MKRIALVALLSALAFGPASAQETIDWLHIATNPAEVAQMEAAVAEYEAANPGIDINMQFLENEAFKSKLTTLLQSDAAPDIFYSWGGGVLTEQAAAGVLRPIEDVLSDEAKANIGAAGINAFTRDGHLYGTAQQVSQVVFWYNKKLMDQAGVDPASMNTWDGFLAGVKKIKEAGIVPIALGAGEKWPAHFYWSYLVVRLAGQEGFNAAKQGEGEGFGGPAFVEAGKKFLELVALEPFQQGYQGAGHNDAAGYFGDGKAAMTLMGDWNYQNSKVQSASKDGVPDADLGMIPFPILEGGAGEPGDTLGGINGWIFHKNAPDAAVKFMEWYGSKDNMSKYAAQGFFIPIVAGAADALANPFQQQVSKNINQAKWHAIFFDQELGADVGGVVNDVSAELSDNAITPEEAANLVKEAVDDSQ